jgi:hypothetical protein
MASTTSTKDLTNEVTNGSELTDLEILQAEVERLKGEVEAANNKAARGPKKASRPPLDLEEATWVAANARPASSSCLCGCKETTKGRFAPGHDAILKTRLHTTAEGDNAETAELANAALVTFGWDKDEEVQA